MSEEELKGKNLLNGNVIISKDNIPENMFISITKEQYAEYMQQKETIEQQQKEIEELKKNIKEIMRKDRDCLTFGYHSAYVGLLDDLIKLIEEE